jgi:hypothetical protein
LGNMRFYRAGNVYNTTFHRVVPLFFEVRG